MNKYLLQAFSMLLILLMSSCSFKHIQLDRAVIQNDSNQAVRNIKVVHQPTGAMGEVNMVLPHSSFELGFLQSRLKADKAQISWVDGMGRHRQAVVTLPSARGQREKMVLVYLFDASGSVTPKLQPAGVEQ